ncbi:glycosyltransferase family 4 protein [Mongoliimonas terrestris]|uniref:glycosyltransferase family 4 protein n=1 Tax=Mongoliimonas terrestris TaxID=1709001 RepID=UPI0009496705|nr:glycosyltransferase family 1 protein [Mongoliimonas terrestris]
MYYINGRFLVQKTSGVQRFAREIVREIDRAIAGMDPSEGWCLLMPGGADRDLDLKCIDVRQVGRLKGHAWEQVDLFRAARTGTLLNLCNSGPVLHPRSVTIIHDAMVFRTPDNFSLAYRSYHQTLGRILARRSVIGTVSDFSRTELMQFLGAKSVFIVPNSAEHILSIEPNDGVLGRLGLEPFRYALFIGSPTPNKNLGTAIAAFELLEASGPRFVVVGSANQSVFGTAETASSERVLFTGRLDDEDVAGLYRAAGALVFPSRYEGFGIPPLEAMTQGCPVVASDIPAVRETCGNAALYVNPLDARGIAAAVNRVFSDDALRADLVALGRARAKHFSWAASARRVVDAVRAIGSER